MPTRKREGIKVRPDNVLRSLPEERQMEIYAKLEKQPAAKVRAWLKADGLDVGTTALYRFAAHWRSELQFLAGQAKREALLAQMLIKQSPGKPEKIAEWGDAMMLAAALADNNPEIWVKLRLIMEKRDQRKLDERKVAVLEAKVDKAKGALGDGSLTPEEQNRRLREILK